MSLRDASRKEYLLRGESAHTDELRTGALQRIADAVEKMAQRHTELIAERDRFERYYRSEIDLRYAAERRCSALQGVITRMKKARRAKAQEAAR